MTFWSKMFAIRWVYNLSITIRLDIRFGTASGPACSISFAPWSLPHLSICLFFYLSICLSVSHYFYLSLFLSLSLSLSLGRWATVKEAFRIYMSAIIAIMNPQYDSESGLNPHTRYGFTTLICRVTPACSMLSGSLRCQRLHHQHPKANTSIPCTKDAYEDEDWIQNSADDAQNDGHFNQ